MIERVLLYLFIKLGNLWFGHVAFSSDPKTDRVVTMVFSSDHRSVDRIFSFMSAENLL